MLSPRVILMVLTLSASDQLDKLQSTIEQMRKQSQHFSSGIEAQPTPMILSLSEAVHGMRLTSSKAATRRSVTAAQLELWNRELTNLRAIARQTAILESLNFESRPVRHSAIPTAHQETSEWIFQGDFVTWLESGEGMF
ncbi:hypothetical protein HJFPF1_12490 [Paramyrothecium foliicola]|nr:hypothetical protein HJFPF1_12490 [Paramyrothecium foliicola]